MTLEKAIFLADELKPNQVERARKIEWLSQLDRQVYDAVLCTHEPDRDTPLCFVPYTQDTPPDTELLVKAPYEDVYRFYLEMHIDLTNLEYDKYNNSLMLYANAWGQFARAYHRSHAPALKRACHRF